MTPKTLSDAHSKNHWLHEKAKNIIAGLIDKQNFSA